MTPLYYEGFVMQKDKQINSELASLTVSMLLSLIYLVFVVCWIIPVTPIMIVWMLDLSFTTVLTLWIVGSSFLCLPLYYFSKIKGK